MARFFLCWPVRACLSSVCRLQRSQPLTRRFHLNLSRRGSERTGEDKHRRCERTVQAPIWLQLALGNGAIRFWPIAGMEGAHRLRKGPRNECAPLSALNSGKGRVLSRFVAKDATDTQSGRGKGDGTMQSEARSVRGSASARPLAELLACPPEASNLLNASAQQIAFVAGDTIFRQDSLCRGLYVVVSGQLLRKAERMQVRLILGTVRVGELVELAAALGDGRHTFTLLAQTAGSLMLLPIDGLNLTFQMYPPLRMRLLEELAREVSRAYLSCSASRIAGVVRRRGGKLDVAQS